MDGDGIVFLVEVDSTLLDDHGIRDDLRRQLERELGAAARDRDRAILDGELADCARADLVPPEVISALEAGATAPGTAAR